MLIRARCHAPWPRVGIDPYTGTQAYSTLLRLAPRALVRRRVGLELYASSLTTLWAYAILSRGYPRYTFCMAPRVFSIRLSYAPWYHGGPSPSLHWCTQVRRLAPIRPSPSPLPGCAGPQAYAPRHMWRGPSPAPIGPLGYSGTQVHPIRPSLCGFAGTQAYAS